MRAILHAKNGALFKVLDVPSLVQIVTVLPCGKRIVFERPWVKIDERVFVRRVEGHDDNAHLYEEE